MSSKGVTSTWPSSTGPGRVRKRRRVTPLVRSLPRIFLIRRQGIGCTGHGLPARWAVRPSARPCAAPSAAKVCRRRCVSGSSPFGGWSETGRRNLATDATAYARGRPTFLR
jgi:hypothetical protein